jgi:hypothetical protein
MSTTTHPVAPEEIMALLDGELPADQAQSASAHLEGCPECRELAASLRGTSQLLSNWTVPPKFVSSEFKSALTEAARSASSAPRLLDPFRLVPFLRRHWILTAASSALAASVFFMFSISGLRLTKSPTTHSRYTLSPEEMSKLEAELQAEFQRAGKLPGATDVKLPDKLPDKLPVNGRNYINFSLSNSQMARDEAPSIGAAPTSGIYLGAAQMIERTASLSLTVKEMDAARTALEELAKQHHGYFAELNTVGQSDAGRTLSASLRVPGAELDATLAELRKLGQLREEKQGGEEVSQQYVDLKARLDNARHTEKRLTELLTKRAAKLKDVLDVERELAGKREEIERMEAQQRNMENQVHYASIDLALREEYKPALNLAPPAAGTRMRNALVDGYHSAMDGALNVLLFLLQVGPSILFWLLLLFFPARWSWRRLRVVAAQKQSLAGAL